MELFSIQNEELEDLTLNLSQIFDRNSVLNLEEQLFQKTISLLNNLENLKNDFNKFNNPIFSNMLINCHQENLLLKELLYDFIRIS
jgi:hypothetical protein